MAHPNQQNQPQRHAQNHPVNTPAASNPPSQAPIQPSTIPAAPYIAPEPVAPQYKKSLEGGMITITADNALQFKLCYAKAGNTLALVHHLRDHFVIDAWGIYRAAREHGFGDVLLLSRDGRISEAGDDTEPPADKTDDVRKLFHDDKANPLGTYGKNVLHISMADEFATVARKKLAAGSTKGRPV